MSAETFPKCRRNYDIYLHGSARIPYHEREYAKRCRTTVVQERYILWVHKTISAFLFYTLNVTI